MPIHIRPADLGDIRALRKMIRDLALHHGDRSDISEAQLHRALFTQPPRAVALLAEADGGGLVGYAILQTHWRPHHGETVLDVVNLYVLDGHRGQGIGRALLAAASQRAAQSGCARLTVGTASQNRAAQDFYRHAGLTELPRPGPRFATPV